MDDGLIRRLRDVPEGEERPLFYDTMREAADEIERLRAVIAALTPACGLGCSEGECPCPSEAAGPSDMPCCYARRACKLGGGA